MLKKKTIRRIRGTDYDGGGIAYSRKSAINGEKVPFKSANTGDQVARKSALGYRRDRSTHKVGSISSPRIKTSSHTHTMRHIQEAKKLEQARKMRLATKQAVRRTEKGIKVTAQAVIKGVKAIAAATRTIYMAAVAAGSTAIAVIVICTLFASSLYLFGNDTSDEYSAEALGVGDTLIMRVASAQLGNVGGKKFWSWYGFEGRVEWCAIFVSWCANQCGYIEKGIIPRFAVVGDGVDWFKARKRFQGNTYIPHPGDVIFFDWDADGTRDHVGFVERCDGRTVYTIEGNSGDACRRLAYRVGSPIIIGYGVLCF